ncbi:hypothetical protein ILYODFUR_011756 [Ilyodon furcidens]|uniref:Uncharacterized protein n=1 Tax=Ilyodon furcidens TaxID=33524 RepID=A0ABV0T776_9TELE
MEEVFGGSRLVLAPPGYKPSQRSPTFVSSAPVSSSSRRWCRCRQPSAAAAATEPSTPPVATAERFVPVTASAEQPTLAVSTNELSSYVKSSVFPGPDVTDHQKRQGAH